VERLGRSDLEGVLRFLDVAYGTVGEEPFPREVLATLHELVPCDSVTFCELDRVEGRVLGEIELNEAAPEPDADVADDDVFWTIVRDHPLCAHVVETRNFRAAKLSDFVTRRQLHASEIYARWFAPWHAEYELDVGIPSPLSHTKTFIFIRNDAWTDFGERDRLVLNMLQPHLSRLYADAQLRRRVRASPASARVKVLTEREREILDLVAEGKTNAEIAMELWIAPTTVRKHLENVYEKLGVRTRTAAAAVALRNV
jgi:DNA-binding CsgD family transcriptional regulator